MKNFMFYLSILMISNIYAQCDDYSQSQCSNDNNCEWVVEIDYGSCNNLGSSACDANPNCWGAYTNPGWYYGWYCAGGSYQIDNSYCEEIEMPECSEMNEMECTNDDGCEWVEDFEIGQCSQFDNSEISCTSYPGECYWDEDITYSSCDGYDNNQWACNNAQGCYWDCYYGYCGCNGQEITGVDTECIGQYEINNSYCEEASFIPGDANGDNTLNVADIVLIVDLILNSEYDEYSDINQDGILNIIDIIELVNRILDR